MPYDAEAAKQSLCPSTPNVSRKKRGNKIVGSDSSSNAGPAGSEQAPVHAGQAPVPAVNAGEPPADASQPAVDAAQAPADQLSHDTRSATPSKRQWSAHGAWAEPRSADASPWNEGDWSRSDAADGWSSSDASRGRSAGSAWEINRRLEYLEEQVRKLHAQNQVLSATLIQTSARVDAGADTSGDAGAVGSDAGGFAAAGADEGDSAAGYADAQSADDSWETGATAAEDERSRWYNTSRDVDDETLAKAKECMRKRLHRVGKLFLFTLEGQGQSTSWWNWFNACRDRGMHQFGIRGQHTDKKPGAQFTFWKCGRSCFNSRVACMRCNSFLYITCDNGSGTFSTRDDEEMCQFFLLETLQHPEAIVR